MSDPATRRNVTCEVFVRSALDDRGRLRAGANELHTIDATRGARTLCGRFAAMEIRVDNPKEFSRRPTCRICRGRDERF